MANCLNCGKEIKIVEGRRPRLYCDNKGKCKGEHFRKQKSQPKYVQFSTFKELKEKFDAAVAANSGRNNAFENAARGRDANGVNNDELKRQPKTDAPERLKGESSIEYRIRMSELSEKK